MTDKSSYHIYKKGYSHKKNKFSIIFGILFSFLLLVLVYLFFSRNSSGPSNIYIGKVVSIKGDINDIGVVRRYKKNQLIELEPVDGRAAKTITYDLGGEFEIEIIAENKSKYLALVQQKFEEEPVSYTESEDQYAEDELKELKDIIDKTKPEIKKGEQKDNEKKVRNENIGGRKQGLQMDITKKNQKADSVSMLDKEKKEVLERFETIVEECALMKDDLIIKEREYADSCTGYSRGTDGFGNPITIENSTTQPCRKLKGEIYDLRRKINSLMHDSIESLTRKGIIPSDYRPICQKYGLPWRKHDYE